MAETNGKAAASNGASTNGTVKPPSADSRDRLKLAVTSALAASVFTALFTTLLAYCNHRWSLERQQAQAEQQAVADQTREQRVLLSKLRGLRYS